MTSRLARLKANELLDRHAQRGKVGRSQVAHALSEYYAEGVPDHSAYRARCGGREIATSIVTRRDWLDLACPLTPDNERLTLVDSSHGGVAPEDLDTKNAIRRLAEAAVSDVRVANVPLYRLLDIDARRGAITGTVGLVPFMEYALTMDLLEGELIDAIAGTNTIRPGGLPLRDKYLPDLGSVVDFSGRLCAGGALALCAIARPSDPYRGDADYALLVQERSGRVLNAARRLAVIPKAFHQPLKDHRADARIGATLRREMEEELFGRREVDSTVDENRVAAPMHRNRLSEPMRWLTEGSDRLRMECTGFGLNMVSGNYEFASLISIEDEDFWARYGGEIEANWESAGLRIYSTLDTELITELASDESWSNEGIFGLLQGLRRLRELGGERVNLPAIEHTCRSW
ncbi:MAG: transcriptional regulator [Pseudonocardiaceae bacterium]|nr:transcriptional regulator [Pseudonocardiaceae bacterium]